MTIACSHDQGGALFEAFDAALPVSALDAPVLALVRACRALSPDNSVIAAVDRDTLTLVFLQGGTIIYDREIEPSPGASGEAWASSASARPWLDALSREVRTSLDFLRQNYPHSAFDSLLIAGEAADRSGVRESLERACALPSRIVRPADILPGGEHLESAADPSLVLALGHALFDHE